MIIEVLGVVSGFICVLLAARSNIWNFPVQIVSVVLYTYIFYNAKLYADMWLQVYFLGMALYGWYFWINRTDEVEKVKPVRLITTQLVWVGLLSVIIFTLLFGTFLKNYTDAFYPYLDSLCAGGSLLGAFLLSRRVLENWLIWIFVDVIYLYLYISKGLYLTTILYIAYIIIAIIGFYEWKKNWKEHYAK